jgi:Fe-S oxidoreductase
MNGQRKNDLYRPYRVDLGGDVFAALRAVRGITYDDTLQAPADKGADARTLFMPGCALASYAPELTHAVYGYLRDTGEVDGLSVTCCGNILVYAATPEERQHYDERLAARLEEHWVRRIVTGCSNCYHAFIELARGGKTPWLEVVALSEVLAQQGLRFSPSREAEFAATGASCLVTYCATCAQALAVPGDTGMRVHARHYLELLFGVGIDWEALDVAGLTAAAGPASAAVPVVREAPTAPTAPATLAATQEART